MNRRCPFPNCNGRLLAQPEDPALNYRGRSDRRIRRWVLVCLSCGRTPGDGPWELLKTAERGMR